MSAFVFEFRARSDLAPTQPGYPEFAGWLGKNSSRNKKIRLLQELRHHMNYKVSADASELRMNYLPVMRQQFQGLLFDKEGAKVAEAIELMDQYGLDRCVYCRKCISCGLFSSHVIQLIFSINRDDLFENLDEFVLTVPNSSDKKFGDLDSNAKSTFTREYNKTAHTSQALVAEQGAAKMGRRKNGGAEVEEAGELDVVDDDKAAEVDDEQDDEEDVEQLKQLFMKKKGAKKSTATKTKSSNGSKAKAKKKSS